MFKRLRKNKKGELTTSMQWAVGLIMMLYAVGFFLDITLIGQQIYAATSANNQLCRIACVQGGILSGPPQGYPDNYVSAGEANNYLDRVLNGISVERYEARVNGGPIPSGEIRYREPVDTEVQITYSWRFMNVMLPGNWTNKTYTSHRAGISEWKYDYSDWGEN